MWRQRFKNVAWGMLGVFLALGLYRAYLDYSDFLKMRAWVAAVQADLARSQANQPKPPTPPQ